MLFDLPVCANNAETGAAYDSACAESLGLTRRRCSCEQRSLFSFPFMNLNEVFLSPPSHSMRRICALTAYIIYSGHGETEFSKELDFRETGDSSEPFFSFSVLVTVLVNTATERDCPEQHPADTAGVRTDEHVKEQED